MPDDLRPTISRISTSRPTDLRPTNLRPPGQRLPGSASQTSAPGSRLHREERFVPAFGIWQSCRPASGTWQPYYNERGQPDRNGRCVRLILLELEHQAGWRVCIWGASDVGVEIDYPAGERARAQEMFETIDSRCLMTRWNLRRMGFRDG